MSIKFKHLKKIKNSEDYLVEYLNGFEGEDVYEKFKNILIQWEKDVSYDVTFYVGDKSIKIGVSYILEELENYNNTSFTVEVDNFIFEMNTPRLFDNKTDAFSVERCIRSIIYGGHPIIFDDLSAYDKSRVINNLLPRIYNTLLHEVMDNKTKNVRLTNPSLQNMNINFLSDFPYQMLEGLFTTFSDDYFRDIIYNLSRKVGGDILMNSTMMDIEYYIDKMNKEGEEEKLPEL